jgi:hypothetical protein
MLKKITLFASVLVLLSSCKLLGIGNKSGANQNGGCPTNGKNVGAEKLLSNDGKAPKAPKYTKGKALKY